MFFVVGTFARPFGIAGDYFVFSDDFGSDDMVVRSDVKGFQCSLPEVCHEVVWVLFSPRVHQVPK